MASTPDLSKVGVRLPEGAGWADIPDPRRPVELTAVPVTDAVWCITHQRTELLTGLCEAAAAGPGLYDGVIQRLYIKKRRP